MAATLPDSGTVSARQRMAYVTASRCSADSLPECQTCLIQIGESDALRRWGAGWFTDTQLMPSAA
jgi:hypothetical protein